MTGGEKGHAGNLSRAAPGEEASSLSPFRYPTFTVLWVATVVSNIGVWMQNAGASWLMTSLDPDPLTVSLVQVATALPMFLFALPAGALADIVDRRRLLLVVQFLIAALVAVFAVLVGQGLVTPGTLLAFAFLAATAAAVIAPAWQSIVPQLIPRENLQAAVALNSVGINVSRAVGPALAGVIIGLWGLAAPFWVNAISTIGVIAGLVWWRSNQVDSSQLPPERLRHALSTGLRHARYNSHLQATLIRAVGFFVFASAYWALLPLVARKQVGGGPELFGVLLGAIGAGAVAGAFVLPKLKRRLGPDRLVVFGTLGTACAMALYAVTRGPALAFAASALAGVSWIAVLVAINVSAQVALPGWVRGRGLAIFVTVMFGSLSVGSALWGQIASGIGLPLAHTAAAIGSLFAIPLLRRWKLQTGAGLDFGPSMHWSQPVPSADLDGERGPVLVTIEYRVAPENRTPFLKCLYELANERCRDGAFDWGVFEDTAQTDRFVETFMLDSWTDHLRQHQRVTKADRAIQDRVNRYQIGNAPIVRHLTGVKYPAEVSWLKS
jgi:predicted MFS family arabinose efflux permease